MKKKLIIICVIFSLSCILYVKIHNDALSVYGIQILSNNSFGEGPIRDSINDFTVKNNKYFIEKFGPNNYQLGTPLVVHSNENMDYSNISSQDQLRKYFSIADSYLFPVIVDGRVIADYETYINEYGYHCGGDIYPNIYKVLKVNNISIAECYLIRTPYGPTFILAFMQGKELSVPVSYRFNDEIFYKLTPITNDLIRNKLSLVSKELKNHKINQNILNNPNRLFFNPGDISSVWDNFGIEYMDAIHKSQ